MALARPAQHSMSTTPAGVTDLGEVNTQLANSLLIVSPEHDLQPAVKHMLTGQSWSGLEHAIQCHGR